MAYHGYNNIVNEHLSKFQSPSILEIGIDRGVMLMPIAVNLAMQGKQFMYVGVDILLQESLKLTLMMFDKRISQCVFLVQNSSLNVLPQIVEKQMKFDLVMIDGDHNYHTVSSELEYLNSITHQQSMVLIDDYDGKWSQRDLWYADRPGYEGNEFATKPIETEHAGVKPAVNNFLQANSCWNVMKPVPGEPVMLVQK